MWRKGNAFALLVGMQTGAAVLPNSKWGPAARLHSLGKILEAEVW